MNTAIHRVPIYTSSVQLPKVIKKMKQSCSFQIAPETIFYRGSKKEKKSRLFVKSPTPVLKCRL